MDIETFLIGKATNYVVLHTNYRWSCSIMKNLTVWPVSWCRLNPIRHFFFFHTNMLSVHASWVIFFYFCSKYAKSFNCVTFFFYNFSKITLLLLRYLTRIHFRAYNNFYYLGKTIFFSRCTVCRVVKALQGEI